MGLEKPALAAHPIHELLARRWSPRAFDPRPVETEKLRSLMEAARWSASSSNEQPWTYLVATREEPDEFARLLGCLVEGNAVWARNAGVLMISVTRLAFAKSAKPNRHAWHDVGLATQNLIVQATSVGLFVHQMGGFFPDKVRETYSVPATHEPVAAMAIGYEGDIAMLPETLQQREVLPRERQPASAFVFTGSFGKAAPWL